MVKKRTASRGLGSLGSGAVTAVALAVQTALAAVVGVLVAHKFGRTSETDGFFEAYGVFVVLALAATASRITVLPALARARVGNRLGPELVSYGAAGGIVALPLVLASWIFAHPLAALLTGFGPADARAAAAATLPWMVLSAVFQLFGGFAASALAALDSYAVAAVGFSLGSLSGVVLILSLVGAHGIRAVAWGMALSGAIAFGVPAVALVRIALAERVPRSAVRPTGAPPTSRLGELALGSAFPLAMQAVYLICLPFAASEGVGSATSFSYAYLIGSAVVAVTASSLGLVTSVGLSRSDVDPVGVARHIVASSWLAFLAVGGAAGVFALAGGRIAGLVLGAAYSSNVGDTLGRLVVVLAPWMVLSVGFSVAFPVLFAAGYGVRINRLAGAAIGVVGVHAGLAAFLRAVWGLNGLAIALCLTTGLALAVVLVGLRALRATMRGLGLAALTVTGMTLAAFVPAGLVLGSLPAACVGLGLYGALIAVIRPKGLRSAVHYLRAM